MPINQQAKILIRRDNLFRLFFAASGRINRRLYITAYLMLLLSFGVFYLSSSYLYPALATLMFLLLVSIAAVSDFILTTKRLKDIGMFSKMAILKVILNFTGIGIAITILLSLIPGRKYSNRYGTPPFRINVPLKSFFHSAFTFRTRVHRFMFIQYNTLLLLIIATLSLPLVALVYFGIVPLDININLSNLSTMSIAFIAYACVLLLVYLYSFVCLLKNRVNDIGLRRGTTFKLIVVALSLVTLDIIHTIGITNFFLTVVASLVSAIFLASFIYIIFAPSERFINHYGRRSCELVAPAVVVAKPEKVKRTSKKRLHHNHNHNHNQQQHAQA